MPRQRCQALRDLELDAIRNELAGCNLRAQALDRVFCHQRECFPRTVHADLDKSSAGPQPAATECHFARKANAVKAQ